MITNKSTLSVPQKMMESQKVVKLTICQCNFNVLRGVPAAVERFLRNRPKNGLHGNELHL
jgi:hypothetical protein